MYLALYVFLDLSNPLDTVRYNSALEYCIKFMQSVNAIYGLGNTQLVLTSE